MNKDKDGRNLRSEADKVSPSEIAIGKPAAPTEIVNDNPPPTGEAVQEYQFPDQPSARGARTPATIDNLKYLLDLEGISVRFNVIKKDVEITIPGLQGTAHNARNVAFAQIKSLCTRHGMSSDGLADYLLAVADSNPRNPVADWITSKPWDGQDRIAAICNTITVAEGYLYHLKNILIQKWLLSAIAAIFMPQKFRSRGVLTFQGLQGIGKTSWFAQLVDERLRHEVVQLGHAWDGGSKDARMSATQHWITEFGELEGSLRKEIESLKAFITLDFDKIRPPYARSENSYPRQTVFAASVNQQEFLKDATGNSRFWTIAVEAIDYCHDIDMQQLWAQMKVKLESGDTWWLSEPEESLLAHHNLRHRDFGATGARVQAALDMSRAGEENLPRMNPGQVLAELGYDKPTNTQHKECAAVLREFLGEPTRSKGYPFWRVPLIVREGNMFRPLPPNRYPDQG